MDALPVRTGGSTTGLSATGACRTEPLPMMNDATPKPEGLLPGSCACGIVPCISAEARVPNRPSTGICSIILFALRSSSSSSTLVSFPIHQRNPPLALSLIQARRSEARARALEISPWMLPSKTTQRNTRDGLQTSSCKLITHIGNAGSRETTTVSLIR